MKGASLTAMATTGNMKTAARKNIIQTLVRRVGGAYRWAMLDLARIDGLADEMAVVEKMVALMKALG